VCHSVLQCIYVTLCCIHLQCTWVIGSLHTIVMCTIFSPCVAVNCGSVVVRWRELQWVAVSCSELQCIWSHGQLAHHHDAHHIFASCCRELQRVAVSCSELQCVAMSCSELQWVARCAPHTSHVRCVFCMLNMCSTWVVLLHALQPCTYTTFVYIIFHTFRMNDL